MGVFAVMTALAGLASILVYDVLWVRSAGSPTALESHEGAAAASWVLGWIFLVAAAMAATTVLVKGVRRRHLPIFDGGAILLTMVLVGFAWVIAPVWGAGTG